MGIRVHKVMGYGLTDLKVENLRIVDERINPEGILGEDGDRWESEDWDRSKYLEYLEQLAFHPRERSDANMKLIDQGEKPVLWEWEFGEEANYEAGLLEDNPSWQPMDSVVHQVEYGMPNVLVLVPPCETKEWRRYDDPIDYVEETQVYQQDKRVVTFKRGLYPWDYLSMDSRSGRVFRGKEHQKLMSFKHLFETIRIARDAEDQADIDEKFRQLLQGLAQELGFASTEECRRFVAPSVPNSVQYLCQFGRIFRDWNTVFQLRPMLYVYWS